MFGELIQRVRFGSPVGGYDEQGNPVVSADVTTPLEIRAFAPNASEESDSGFGDGSVSGATVYANRGIDVTPADRLIIRGHTWQVEGEIGDWLSPYPQAPNGVVFAVRRAS